MLLGRALGLGLVRESVRASEPAPAWGRGLEPDLELVLIPAQELAPTPGQEQELALTLEPAQVLILEQAQELVLIPAWGLV